MGILNENRCKTNVQLFSILGLIMFSGYIGRVLHIKDVYRAYHYDKEKPGFM